MNKTLRYVLSLLLLLATSSVMQAATYDWLGGTSSAWTNGANWDPLPPTYPEAGDRALFGVNQAVPSATIDLGDNSLAIGTNSVHTIDNTALSFAELGGINNYTLTNGSLVLATDGILVGTNVTLNVHADVGDASTQPVNWYLGPDATLNIGAGVVEGGRFHVSQHGGGDSVVNVNAENWNTFLWQLGPPEQNPGQNLTVNVNADQAGGSFGWFLAGEGLGSETKLVIRNGATINHITRLYCGATSGNSGSQVISGGTGRMVIGDESTAGYVDSVQFFRFGYTGGEKGVLDVVNGQFNIRQSAATPVLLPYFQVHNANDASTLAEINLYTNGVLNSGNTFEQNAPGNGVINFRGGTLQADVAIGAAQANNWLKSGLPVYVYDGGAVVDNNGKNITFNTGLQDPGSSTGGLSLIGGGSTTLNGANTFTGPTLVKEGTLGVDFGFSTLSSITVSNGAALGFKSGFLSSNPDVTVADGGGVRSLLTYAGTDMQVNSLTLGDTAAGAVFNVQFGAGVNDSITVAGAGGLTLNGLRVNTFAEGTEDAYAPMGTFTLINYSGTLNGNVTNVVINNPTPGLTYTFADTGSAITLTIALDGSINQWAVDADGDWSNSPNWTISAPDGVDAKAFFGPAISAAHTVNSDSAHTVGQIDFVNPNAYTVGGAGVITLDSSSNALVSASIGSHSISAPMALAANTHFTAAAGKTLTLAGDITGGGSFLVTNNAGTVEILGTNAVPFTVESGTVRVTAGGQVTQPLTLLNGSVTYIDSEENLGPNPGAPNPAQLLLDGAALLLTGTATIDDSNRGITLGTNGGTIGTDSGGYTLTIANPITGNGSLVKTYATDGTLVLTAANTYSGDTIVDRGELVVGNGGTTGTLGTGTNVIIQNGSTLTLNRSDLTTLANNVMIGAGGGRIRNNTPNLLTLASQIDCSEDFLYLDAANADMILAAANLLNYGELRKEGAGTLTFTGSYTDAPSAIYHRAQVENGTLAFASGADWTFASSANPVDIRVGTVGGLSAALAVSNGASLTLNALWQGFVNGSQGTSCTIDGGDMTLVGTNGATYPVLILHYLGSEGVSDNVTVDNGGTLTATDPASVVDVGFRGDANFTINNGTVSVNRMGFGRVEGSSALVASGNCAMTLNAGSLNISNQFELMRDTSATAGRINTVDLNGGTLRTVAMNCTHPDATVNFNFNGGTLVALGDALTGSGTLSDFLQGVDYAYVYGGGAFIDSGGYDMTITQDLQDGGGTLTKLGSGTLYLNGANAYSGLTLVSAGTLGGTGSVAGSVTVASGAGLAPGASVGTFTIGGNLTLSNSTIAIELNKDLAQSNDVVSVSGAINYGTSTMIVTNLGATSLVAGDTFAVFPAGGSGSVSVVAPAGTTMSFNPATGVLAVDSAVVPDPGTLGYSVAGNVITFGWTNLAAGLQYQTNALLTGLSTNWVAYPDTSNPVNVTNDATVPASFFRLSIP